MMLKVPQNLKIYKIMHPKKCIVVVAFNKIIILILAIKAKCAPTKKNNWIKEWRKEGGKETKTEKKYKRNVSQLLCRKFSHIYPFYISQTYIQKQNYPTSIFIQSLVCDEMHWGYSSSYYYMLILLCTICRSAIVFKLFKPEINS